MDYTKKFEHIRKFTKKSVKKSRYEHSQRVAQLCVEIAEKYGLDKEKAYLAGIGHDMCKDLSDEKMLETAERDGLPIIDFERKKISLLHGRAAAVVMKEKFGITDADVLEAVANHTSGIVGMCDLTKCLYIADKIEPGRPHSSKEYVEQMLELPFEELFYKIMKDNYNFIISKGYEVFPGTEKMMNQSEEKMNKMVGIK